MRFLRSILACSGLFLTGLVLADDVPPDFGQVGTPFLKQHCLECHSDDEPEAGLSLTPLISSQALIKDRKTAEKILDVLRFGQMPPDGNERPDSAAIDAFLDGTDAILEYSDRTATPDPGRITMRRLNRTEYANTVRDLFGLDFNPAEDFPSDDIGYGFDNIGDVLTLPPVLMERYLAAAESISERAITPNPPEVPRRQLATRYAEPAGRDVPEDRFRPITLDEPENGIKTGPLFTRYQVPEGNYKFRTRVFAEAPEGQVVKVAILAGGTDWTDGIANDEDAAQIFGAAVNGLKPFRIIDIIEVTARKADDAQRIEVQFGPVKGLERMAVALVKPELPPAVEPQPEAEQQELPAGDADKPADEADKPAAETEKPAPPAIKLFVEHLSLEGPLDTRPPFQQQLMSIASNKPVPDQTREIVKWIARRIYRRTPTDDELSRLITLVNNVQAGGQSREQGLQLALQAMLVSPKFLFRVELDENPASPERRPLDEFQLASRLSYFIWSTMPDDELLDLAERGELSQNIEPQVRRMLADPRAASLVDNFALQWLQLKRLDLIHPDLQQFPDFNDRLRQAMLEETRLFMQEIFREDHNVMDLIGADFTYVNFGLARHYGIDLRDYGVEFDPNRRSRGDFRSLGRNFYRIELKDGSRGGLLTQASVLTVTSNPTRTSPVKRGRWILEQLMGTPPPPPPPNVPELEAQKDKLTGSLREQMEQHRENPSCANCHAKMDPIGFAFENFDAIGRYRDKDGEFEIDASGELPGGRKFSGPKELTEILKGNRQQFVRCLSEKLLTYALGRGLEYYDRPAVNRILRSMEEGGDRFSTLVVAITQSEPFLYRRGQ